MFFNVYLIKFEFKYDDMILKQLEELVDLHI